MSLRIQLIKLLIMMKTSSRGDLETNMLPLGKFLSTGLVKVYLLTLFNLNPIKILLLPVDNFFRHGKPANTLRSLLLRMRIASPMFPGQIAMSQSSYVMN